MHYYPLKFYHVIPHPSNIYTWSSSFYKRHCHFLRICCLSGLLFPGNTGKIASHLGHTSTDNEELRFTRGFHPFMAKLTDFIFHRILIFLILWVFFGLLTPNLKQVAIPYTPSPHPSHSSMSRKTITIYLLYACAIIILTI